MGRHTARSGEVDGAGDAEDEVGPGEGSAGASPFGLTEAEAELVLHELVVAWRKGMLDGVIIGWLVALVVALLILT